MKFLIALILLLFAEVSGAFDEPDLPIWQDEEREKLLSSGWVPGAILLTGDPVPDEVEKPAASPLEVEPPKPGEIAGDLKPSTEIAEKYLPAYFAERPSSFLIDPQGLLEPTDFRDRLGFLNYHASDSTIDLFVYVIGGDQDIPGEVREEEMIERFFAEGRPAAVVYYYLGAPQRSVVYLSPTITDEVSAAEQRRALESSVMQAFEKTNHSEQFEKFLVQMSIRIYWMERMLKGQADSAEIVPDRLPLSSSNKTASVATDRAAMVRELVLQFAVPASLLLGGIMTIFGLNHWLKLRARYRFPEFDIEPRLGGNHAAGVGAVISFASASLPPASQREQVPDYLRRA